jgi:hypothetical protein
LAFNVTHELPGAQKTGFGLNAIVGSLLIEHDLELIRSPVERDILLRTQPVAQNYLVFFARF